MKDLQKLEDELVSKLAFEKEKELLSEQIRVLVRKQQEEMMGGMGNEMQGM